MIASCYGVFSDCTLYPSLHWQVAFWELGSTKGVLAGLGQPWELYSWECDDDAEESVLVAASQHIDKLVTKLHPKKSSSRWSSPSAIKNLRKRLARWNSQKDAKTDWWAVFVWVQWASYRHEKIIEESETKHPISLPCLKTDWSLGWWNSSRKYDTMMQSHIPQTVSIRYAVDSGVLCVLLTDQKLISSTAQGLQCSTIPLIPASRNWK